MFRGSYSAKIDDKGRLKMPSEFRRIVEETWGPEVFMTSVEGEHALLYPLSVWESIEQRLAALPSTDRHKRRYLARVNYFGQQGRLDSQGRIVAPPILRETARMEGEVVVCGALDHLEVWNKERFDQKLIEEPFTDDDFKALTEQGI